MGFRVPSWIYTGSIWVGFSKFEGPSFGAFRVPSGIYKGIVWVLVSKFEGPF